MVSPLFHRLYEYSTILNITKGKFTHNCKALHGHGSHHNHKLFKRLTCGSQLANPLATSRMTSHSWSETMIDEIPNPFEFLIRLRLCKGWQIQSSSPPFTALWDAFRYLNEYHGWIPLLLCLLPRLSLSLSLSRSRCTGSQLILAIAMVICFLASLSSRSCNWTFEGVARENIFFLWIWFEIDRFSDESGYIFEEESRTSSSQLLRIIELERVGRGRIIFGESNCVLIDIW